MAVKSAFFVAWPIFGTVNFICVFRHSVKTALVRLVFVVENALRYGVRE